MSTLTDDKIESNYKGSALLHLLSYMKPYAGWVAVCLILVLALTGFDLYRPMLIGDAIDLFEKQGNYDVIIDTTVKYGIVLVLSFIFNISQTWLLQKMGQSIILTVRKDLYAHIQSLSSRYFDLTPVGRLVTRVTNDVEALDEMYSGILVRLFRNIVKIIGLAAVMLMLDFRLALISFVLLPFVAVLTVIFRKIARQTYRISRTRLTDVNTFLSENISGMRIIQIFGREKFLQREQGRKILAHCGIALEQLAVYRTTEPLAYYSCSVKTPQNVLILENKDTFYSIRRHLLSGRTTLFGTEISTVIYGAGKGILRSFEDFGFCVEPHINDASNRILYFGDLDYEGIGIYERLHDLFASAHAIDPFVQAYEYMTEKAAYRGLDGLPRMSERQNQALTGTFFSYFSREWEEEVCRMLQAGRYIPQEIINVTDFTKEPGDAV